MEIIKDQKSPLAAFVSSVGSTAFKTGMTTLALGLPTAILPKIIGSAEQAIQPVLMFAMSGAVGGSVLAVASGLAAHLIVQNKLIKQDSTQDVDSLFEDAHDIIKASKENHKYSRILGGIMGAALTLSYAYVGGKNDMDKSPDPYIESVYKASPSISLPKP